jgi:hypothetical protein
LDGAFTQTSGLAISTAAAFLKLRGHHRSMASGPPAAPPLNSLNYLIDV